MGNKAKIFFIIDESGSMASKAEDVRGGFKTYLDELRGDGNEYTISVTKFNNTSHVLYENKTLEEVIQLPYSPSGGTALLDAIGDTLNCSNNLEVKHSVCKECGEAVHNHIKNKTKNIVIIMTDGEENSSHRFTKSQIKAQIEERQGRGNWTFLFLGADMDAFHEASSIGVYTGNSYRYDPWNTRIMYMSAARSTSGLTASASMSSQTFGSTVSDDANEIPTLASLVDTFDQEAVNNNITEPELKKKRLVRKKTVTS